jgi:hypothetical protein
VVAGVRSPNDGETVVAEARDTGGDAAAVTLDVTDVNSVAPTFIRTPGTAERLDRPEFLADVLERLPVGRVGTTTDVAGGWTAR